MRQLGDWQPAPLIDTATLVVATFHYPPYTLVNASEPGRVTGYLADLMSILAQRLGVGLRYDTNNTVGDFGVRRPDGSYTGLVGKLVDKTAHVALAPLTWRSDRTLVADYMGSVPVSSERYVFMTPGRQRAAMDDVRALLTPFDSSVWGCLLFSLVLAGLLLRLTVAKTRPPDADDAATFGFISSFVHIYACVVQQGWSVTPRRASARLVTLSGRLLGLLVYCQYTAVLISVMTVTRREAGVDSVAQFATAGDAWTLLIQPGLAYTTDWQTSQDPALRTLYGRLHGGGNVKHLSPDNMHQMFDPTTVTFFDRVLAAHYAGDRVCGLVTLGMTADSGQAAAQDAKSTVPQFLLMQKNLLLKPEIRRVMQTLYETGSVDSLFRRWFSGDSVCLAPARFRSLGFDDLLAIAYIIPAGLVMSLALLGLECLSAHYLESRYKDQRPIEHKLWRL